MGIFKYIRNLFVEDKSKILIKDIKEFSKHHIHIVKDIIKKDLDNMDLVKYLEGFYELNMNHTIPFVEDRKVIDIPLTIEHDWFNALSIRDQEEVIYGIIGIEFNLNIISLTKLGENKFVVSLRHQNCVYLLCKAFGYIDKLMEVIAKDINSRIASCSLHKNNATFWFRIFPKNHEDFKKHLKGIFPSCYNLEYDTSESDFVLILKVNWK